MREVAKTILVNLLVVLGLLLVFELGYRAVKFAGTCIGGDCDATWWQAGNLFRHNVDIDLSRPDPVLGHVPNDGDFDVPWLDEVPIHVRIRNGVRLNGDADAAPEVTAGNATLAIGDSFTFGDEVHDADTWPACLERRWHAPVVNAGVFGYGAAQAVLRAQQMQREAPYRRVIWSILVGHDFERDQLVSRSNEARPAVVRSAAGLRYTTVEESQQVLDDVTTPGIAKHADLFGYLYVTKLAWQSLSRFVLPAGVRYDGRWIVPHPQAASPDELMRFALDQFAALDAPQKYVLLQYPVDRLDTMPADAAHEMRTIRKLAAERYIEVIDTPPLLRSAPNRAALYRKHHTAEGNRTVCEAIAAVVLDESGSSTPTQPQPVQTSLQVQ
jgi:hypothetical protein